MWLRPSLSVSVTGEQAGSTAHRQATTYATVTYKGGRPVKAQPVRLTAAAPAQRTAMPRTVRSTRPACRTWPSTPWVRAGRSSGSRTMSVVTEEAPGLESRRPALQDELRYLLNRWDPIGVYDELLDCPPDEYDCLLGPPAHQAHPWQQPG
jgi:hypothetical protein